ncbi:MAG: HIRAN domain-containing protein [Solobacterium sp.]|nr:HIRAN domain-containing protein [Solobacterium sp.]
MNKQLYITLSHLNEFMGIEYFRPGMEVILKKDPGNLYDDEAIEVYGKDGPKYGYVANSVGTVARGTHSAGYIYEIIGDSAKCVIRFVTQEEAIAEILTE